MGPEYLLSIPINIFHLYIQLFNERKEQEEFDYKQAQQAKKGENEMPKMVGNSNPKKPSS